MTKPTSELQLDHGGTPEERQAIEDAVHDLNALRKELADIPILKQAKAEYEKLH